MKKFSNGAKFLIVCGCLFVIGAALAIGGFLAGGSSAFDQNIPEAVRSETTHSDYEFSSIESTGALDLEIVGSKYYYDALDDHDISDISPETGRVIVISPQGEDAPDIKADGGTLVINGGSQNKQLSVGDLSIYKTTVIVFAGDALDSIRVSSEACDTDIKGVKFGNAGIGLNAGDVDLEDVISGGIKVANDAGEISVSGDLSGLTDLYTAAGDIEVSPVVDPRSYSMDLHADAGTISIEDEDDDSGSYSQTRGDDMLKLKTDAGDIDIEMK